MKALHSFLGAPVAVRYEVEVEETDVYLTIGRNAVAGFVPVVFTLTAQGEPLKTPSGERMTVVALVGGSGRVHSVFALTGGGR
ncbi:hypothetical protein [Streptomyces sp. NPDC093111]|uniref:hypothetical protein n=1 Tax=Streptomyces sp. NPDC093111 TaxID=3154978 RepID=UPI00341B9B8B